MDEPLASLDQARKSEILPFIERLRDELQLPMIYVSHSLAEVARLASSVVLLSRGRVLATGATPELLGRLDLAPISASREAGAVLEMTVASHDHRYQLTTLASDAGQLRIPLVDSAPGSKLRLQLRARDVVLSLEPPPAGISALNILSGRIAEIGPLHNSAAEVRIELGDGSNLLARVTHLSLDRMDLKPGLVIYAIIKSVALDRRSQAQIHSTPEGLSEAHEIEL